MTPRPIFLELGQTDMMGWGWVRDRAYVHDDHGTWVFDDLEINLIVVAIGDVQRHLQITGYGPEGADMFFSDGCVVKIGYAEDVLEVYRCERRVGSRRLAPGDAAVLDAELRSVNPKSIAEFLVELGWVDENWVK